MDSMTLADYAAVRDIECRRGGSWGYTTALWVLVAAVIVFAVIYNWTKNCNEKVQFATGLSNLNGRIECIAPQVATLNAQMYGAAQAFAGLTVGVNEMRENSAAQFAALNNTVFFNPANQGYFCGQRRGSNCGCGCGTPNRIFAQTQTYAPKDQQVTVTETCGNDRC